MINNVDNLSKKLVMHYG